MTAEVTVEVTAEVEAFFHAMAVSPEESLRSFRVSPIVEQDPVYFQSRKRT